jgi:hypothetical protein
MITKEQRKLLDNISNNTGFDLFGYISSSLSSPSLYYYGSGRREWGYIRRNFITWGIVKEIRVYII